MRIFCFFILFHISFGIFSQNNVLNIKSGSFDIEYGINNDFSKSPYKIAVFEALLKQEEKKEFEDLGFVFLEYIDKNTYIVSCKNQLPKDEIISFGVITLQDLLPEYKIDAKIQNNIYPEWSFKNGSLSIKVVLHRNVIISDIIHQLDFLSSKELNIYENSNSISLNINPKNLLSIASFPFVSYIEPIDPPSMKENDEGRTLHRSNTINTNFHSGRHYDGSGINIMMQDDGLIGPHIDYMGRIDQSNCGGCSSSSSNDHGDHVAGTIMGSGNLDPLGAGMANAAFLYVYGSSNNNYYDVPTLYQNNDVIITSKSYSNGCNAGYTSLSKDLDEQINSYPSLIHVFSAGNDGNSDCGYGAGSGWGNVTGGHKQAKNVISVANLNSTGGLASSSSRGPAADGRIKPDISAKGTSVYSTVPSYDYENKTGTSMSCPGVAGVMAQLYQAYKELNAGQNPNSALMKCVLLNSADDIGNAGPDFKHGWGEVNAFRAVKILEENQYFNSTISQSTTNNHQIVIPAGIDQVKIMVYWHDVDASTSASIALVNDINSSLQSPSGFIYDPWVLDESPSSSSLNSTAIRGTDNLNNMEQITLDNPSSGVYNLIVDGFAIPSGPQEYWVSYEFINSDVTLTYPIGGEGFAPGETQLIRWDASKGSSSFSLEYTIDGINWITISNSINSIHRYYSWSVPNISTDKAKVRVSRGSSIDESDNFFTIVRVPQNIIVDWTCPDSIYLYWNAVSGATSYEVSMLGNVYMDSMTTTNLTSAFILNPNPSITDSWFSVCAKINNGKGRRAYAINAQPTHNGCVAPPVADFSVSHAESCSGEVVFYDLSQNQPNSWTWDFGDGNTSSQQNPTHVYANSGNYTVTLIVSNSLGVDTVEYQNITSILYNTAPIAYNDTSYVNPSIFTLSSPASNVKWYADTLGSLPVYSGSNFVTPLLFQNTTYYARNFGSDSIFGGPLDNNIGTGGYYNNDRHLYIDCYKPSTLVSFDVYAGTAHDITFELRDNNSNVLQDTTIMVQLGLNSLYVDFDVPLMNDLELGISASNSDLWRSSSGASYPYPIGSLASITGHNSPWGDPQYHYFFYNIQMMENCKSEYAEATAIFLSPQSIYDINQEILIYPNPSSSNLTISSQSNIDYVYIYDISSRLVFSDDESSDYLIDVSSWSSGIYFIEMNIKGSVVKEKVVVYHED